MRITTKIIAITAIALSSLLSTGSQAATKSTPLTLKFSPIAMISENYSGEIDVGVSENVSIGLIGEYMPSLEKVVPKDYGLEGKAYSVGLRSTFHGEGVNNDGVYVSTGLHLNKYKMTHEGEDVSGNSLAGVFFTGYQWHSEQGISTQLGAGFQKHHFFNANGGVREGKITPTVEFNVGYTI